MAKGGRIAGGILALIGGGMGTFAGILSFLLMIPTSSSAFLITGGVTTICGVLGVVGGILLLVDKTAGGVLAIVGGTVVLVGIFITIDSGSYISGIYIIYWTATVATHLMFYIDPALMLVGGIVGLAVGSEL